MHIHVYACIVVYTYLVLVYSCLMHTIRMHLIPWYEAGNPKNAGLQTALQIQIDRNG